MESIQGKHFSITDPEGVSTVIYRINRTPKEYVAEYPKYTVERLVSSEDMKGTLTKRTDFINFILFFENLIFRIQIFPKSIYTLRIILFFFLFFLIYSCR